MLVKENGIKNLKYVPSALSLLFIIFRHKHWWWYGPMSIRRNGGALVVMTCDCSECKKNPSPHCIYKQEGGLSIYPIASKKILLVRSRASSLIWKKRYKKKLTWGSRRRRVSSPSRHRTRWFHRFFRCSVFLWVVACGSGSSRGCCSGCVNGIVECEIVVWALSCRSTLLHR
jgi:hypothetical protein